MRDDREDVGDGDAGSDGVACDNVKDKRERIREESIGKEVAMRCHAVGNGGVAEMRDG